MKAIKAIITIITIITGEYYFQSPITDDQLLSA